MRLPREKQFCRNGEEFKSKLDRKFKKKITNELGKD